MWAWVWCHPAVAAAGAHGGVVGHLFFPSSLFLQLQRKHYGLRTVARDLLPRVMDELERFKLGLPCFNDFLMCRSWVILSHPP